MQLKWRWGNGGWCWLHGYKLRDGRLGPLSVVEAHKFIGDFRIKLTWPPGPPVPLPEFVMVFQDGSEEPIA